MFKFINVVDFFFFCCIVCINLVRYLVELICEVVIVVVFFSWIVFDKLNDEKMIIVMRGMMIMRIIF